MLRGATGCLEALAPVLPPPKHAGASDEELASLAKILDDMNLKQLKSHEKKLKAVIASIRGEKAKKAKKRSQPGAS